MTAYPVLDVSDWYVAGLEPGGDDVKYWLVGAAGEPGETSWLFKTATIKQIPVRRSDGGGTRRYQKGEDWVEKIASELASMMGLPAVRIELAMRHGAPGLISRDARPPAWVMHGGGVFISEVDERYRPKTDTDPRRNRVGHNLDNIEAVLRKTAPPPGYALIDFTAFDTFAGYLLFDAWIANRDRHEDNWGILRDPYGDRYLAPSFDHGAALGTGLEDAQREELLLETGEVRAWCMAPTAHRFEDCAEVPLIALARQALTRANPDAAGHWVRRLVDVTEAEIAHVLDRIPNMSDVARTFTGEVLRINQERIRDDFAGFGTGQQ